MEHFVAQINIAGIRFPLEALLLANFVAILKG
jgi:hypothetical protein